jgi:aspartate carbamoyltransferase
MSTFAVVENSLTESSATWVNQPYVSVKQMSPKGLRLLLSLASEMKALVKSQGGDDRLKHRVLATIFYEPSTRTMGSFQTAMLRLGGSVINVDTATSSVKKGETLSDTIRCLSCYADAIVIRHPTTGAALSAAESRGGKVLVNAGDGVGEHPSQALLDIFTIEDELRSRGGLAGKRLVLLGDLANGRTVHSLVKLIARSGVPGVSLVYCSPASLRMPSDVFAEVAKHGLEQSECTDLTAAIAGADVLYVTRVQKERFADVAAYDAVKDLYVVNEEVMKNAPEGMCVLHPLPRVNEIAVEVDKDPRAAYFRQMENGMYVRMALLALLLGKSGV